MDNKLMNNKLIDYLNARGLSNEEISKILNDNEKKSEILKAINEYERTQRRNGIIDGEALKYYEYYLRMMTYHNNREAILKELHGKI